MYSQYNNSLNKKISRFPEPPKKKLKIGRWILLAFIVYYLFNYYKDNDFFESQVPIINFPEKQFWNLNDVIHVTISDNKFIKSYKITLHSDTGEPQILQEAQFEDANCSSFDFNLTFPKIGDNFRDEVAKIQIQVIDDSWWNWFNGNKTEHEYSIIVDQKKPEISLIATSYGIRRGGSALIIFKVKEKNIKTIKIKTRSGRTFIPQHFLSLNGYYASLIAWHVNDPTFKASIVAEDRAGNIQNRTLNIYLKEKKYKRSQINLSDRFLNGKITELAVKHEKSSFTDNPLEYFRIVNEDMRHENEDIIHKVTSQINKEIIVQNFNIKPFRPLKGYMSVASFGDHRKFYYEGEFVSESYHLGLDLASTRQAKIYASNGGKIVYCNNNGVYGLSPIVSHGFGLFTIYAHCSSTLVKVGDKVSDNEIIAHSGVSGLALGDHLHFGIYVQGVEVRPEEWMDKKWIKTNITNVMTEAKKIIERL